MGDVINRYLADLDALLDVSGRERERIVAETEDHLRESARVLASHGAAAADANVLACDRFGDVRAIAASFNQASFEASLKGVWWQIVQFSGVGLVTIGVSGLVGWVAAAFAGKDFVAGNPTGTVISASRCRDYLGFHPESADCYRAAVAHHFDEFVGYHLDALALGVIVLAGWSLVRWRSHGSASISPRARRLTNIGAAVAFAFAAVVMLPLAWDDLRDGTATGGGSWLVSGCAALVACFAYVAVLARQGRSRRAIPD